MSNWSAPAQRISLNFDTIRGMGKDQKQEEPPTDYNPVPASLDTKIHTVGLGIVL